MNWFDVVSHIIDLAFDISVIAFIIYKWSELERLKGEVEVLKCVLFIQSIALLVNALGILTVSISRFFKRIRTCGG